MNNKTFELADLAIVRNTDIYLKALSMTTNLVTSNRSLTLTP